MHSSSGVSRPNLKQLKLQARELLADFETGQDTARQRVARALPKLAGDSARTPALQLKLSDGQLVIARENGFDSWPKLKSYSESGAGALLPFLRAALAVVNGDIETLRSMLEQNPELIKQRSTEQHRAQLLHYIAVNGVENHLQRTPPNAVDVCRRLLQSGAEVDSPCETYGGDANQTTMNLLVSSLWPHRAGLQGELVDLLLDAGAAMEGPLDDGSPLRTALQFGYPATAQVLARRGARVACLDLAAGLGQTAEVQALWDGRDRCSPDAEYRALILACRNDQVQAVALLLDLGVDIDTHPDPNQGTALHEAILWDRPNVVRALLERNADTTIAHGRWQATALDFASYNGRLACAQILLDAGVTTDLNEALVSAVQQNHPQMARRLIQAGAGKTPALVRAGALKNTAMIELLS